MKVEKTNVRVKYVELNKEVLTDSPFCRDIFHCQILSDYHVLLMYTLRLFDECSELIGEYKAECELECNQRITSLDLDEFMLRLSYGARERFNKEANKYHIRLYIPRAEKLYLSGEIEDAA